MMNQTLEDVDLESLFLEHVECQRKPFDGNPAVWRFRAPCGCDYPICEDHAEKLRRNIIKYPVGTCEVHGGYFNFSDPKDIPELLPL